MLSLQWPSSKRAFKRSRKALLGLSEGAFQIICRPVACMMHACIYLSIYLPIYLCMYVCMYIRIYIILYYIIYIRRGLRGVEEGKAYVCIHVCM
jgi:hypothetical protein